MLCDEDGLTVLLQIREQFSGPTFKRSDEFCAHIVILKYHFDNRASSEALGWMTCRLSAVEDLGKK